MSCSYCRRNIGHEVGCPFYEPPKSDHYCSICDEEIQFGEEYVENIYDEYAHMDCLYSGREMAEFLEVKIKKME